MPEKNTPIHDQETNPVIEGEVATFLWHGPAAPALMGDFNGWNPQSGPAFSETRPGLWSAGLELAPDAYMEYTFLVNGERVPDPLNPQRIPNGLGKFNNYFYMPAAARSPLRRRTPAIPHGTITRHTLQHPLFPRGKRTAHLYHPPAAGPCPLMVVFDGGDYLRRASLPIIVNNLQAAGRMRPVALAMIDNGGPTRTVEYACSEATLGYLADSLIPLAEKELNLTDPHSPGGTFGVMGASMGGLMSLYTALRSPTVFGKVLSQSGAFGFGEQKFVVWDLIRYGAPLPEQIWMNAGRYEWLLQCNRDMAELLHRHGAHFTYSEYSAGHNYTAWGNTLAAGLEALFPPQAG